MKVIITAGGSGGHIYPAIAIINKIKEMEPNSEFIYIGTTNRMEKDIIPSLGIKYIGIEAYGLTKKVKENIKAIAYIHKNTKKCMKIMCEFKPDIVLGIGGYVTYPVIRAAKKLHIKTFIHEQNSIPGKSNRALSKIADKIGVSFPNSIHYFDESKVIYTGNPCSERALAIAPIDKTKFGLDPNKKLVLMVQGSLGSPAVNDKMKDYLKNVDNEDYEVLYITGKPFYEEFKKNIFSKNVFLVPYVENLAGLMKNADVIVSRAGASSISEIIALKKLSILIPSPYVANNHQFFNALDIANSRAAIMIEENALTTEVLKEQINKLLTDEEMRINMKLNIKKLQKNDSSTIIYNCIKEMISNGQKNTKTKK